MSSVPQKAIKHKMDLLSSANEPGNVARACKRRFVLASAGAVRMCGTHNFATAFVVIGRIHPMAGDRCVRHTPSFGHSRSVITSSLVSAVKSS